MKKLIALIMMAMVVVSAFAGCGNDPLVSGGATTATTASDSNATADEVKKISKDDYKKDYNGLVNYFNDLGYIESEKPLEMQSKLIGATKGNRYVMGAVSVELYAFDTKKLSKEAKDVIASVEKDGTFTLYNKTVEACLSANNKYLMIYTDAAADDKASDAYKKKQAAIKALKGFE